MKKMKAKQKMTRLRGKIESIIRVMRSDLYAVVSFEPDDFRVTGFLPDSMAEPILDAVRDISIDLEREAERVAP